MNTMSAVREISKGREDWKKKKDDVIRLIKSQEFDRERIILFASGWCENSILVKTAICKEETWKRIEEDNRHRWDDMTMDTSLWCGMVEGGGQAPRIEYGEEKMRIGGDKHENPGAADRVVEHRTFEGMTGRKDYYDIRQELLWAHGLHWVRENKAWCRLDDNGDVEDVIKIEEIDNTKIIHANSEMMEMQTTARGELILLVFDCMWTRENFKEWKIQETKKRIEASVGLYYEEHEEEDQGWIRGVKVIRKRHDKYTLAAHINSKTTEKRYEEFLVCDWRHRRLVKMTLEPKNMTSYYENAEGKPYEISPIFFDGEVLSKYKMDKEKYTLTASSITCRNAWHIKSWDYNEEGQVFAYAKDLAGIPYEEQMHWKQFNEKPKAWLPERTIRTDFIGKWREIEPGIERLIETIRRIMRNKPEWFEAEMDELEEQIQYPLSRSKDEWAQSIAAMQQVVVEGLKAQGLKRICIRRGKGNITEDEKKWRGIRWAQEALVYGGMDKKEAEKTVESLKELQQVRSWMWGHKRGESWSEKVRDLLEEYGTAREHVRGMAERCAESLDTLHKMLNKEQE